VQDLQRKSLFPETEEVDGFKEIDRPFMEIGGY
jgi:hypothetical protein